MTNFTNWTIFKLDKNLPISTMLITLLVNSFWKKVARKLDKNQKFRIQAQFKLGFNYRSLSYIQILDNSTKSKDIFIKLLLDRWEIQSSKYHDLDVDELFLRYKLIKDSKIPITINNDPQDLIETTRLTEKDVDLDLPHTMDLNLWSDNITFITKNAAFFIKNDLKHTFVINNDNTKIEVKITDLENNLVFEFSDTRESVNSSDTFQRIFKKETISYVNGVKNNSFMNDTKFITKLAKDKVFSFNVITMDLETQLSKDNVMNPISVGIYDGKEYQTFFITDYMNSVAPAEQMLRDSFNYLMQGKYNNYHIYLHNFSKFDGVFLLKIISNLDAKVNLLIRDNNLLTISISFEINDDKYKIHLHDSLLLLPASLEKLAINFGVESKGNFDFSKINDAKTTEQLNLIREELLAYNKQDCLVLYQVMFKYAENIWELYSLNLTQYPTLSSLSFAIFKSNFMKEENIPISNTKDYNFLKDSYRGGHVDVYRPYPKKGRKVYCYDINSLYPSVMAKNVFPVGVPKYFTGSRELNDIFGFVKVEVTSPSDLFCPVLLTKVDGKTIAPTGQWTGTYFVEELKYAATLGYKFNILEGVTFDQANIFDNFINTLYEQRIKYPKSDPRNLIGKLSMNTGYGRYGMSPYIDTYSILSKDNLNNLNYLDSINLGDKELVSFRKVKNTENNNFMMSISTGIASAVTSYSRIEINKLKLKFIDNLLYSDTDSIYLDKEITNKELINNRLGGLKLEYILTDAVFLAPKVYAGVFEDGTEMSKVKGYKKPVNLKDLKTLLVRNKSLELKHDKWFRSFSAGNISIKESTYNLVVSANKRKNIYRNNKLFHTKPIKIKTIKPLSN